MTPSVASSEDMRGIHAETDKKAADVEAGQTASDNTTLTESESESGKPNTAAASARASTFTATTAAKANKKAKKQKKQPQQQQSLSNNPNHSGTTTVLNTSTTAVSSAAAAHSPAPAQDVHPYARGAVIEVLYIPVQALGKTAASIQAATSADPWYWSEDSSLCSTTSNSSSSGDEFGIDDNDQDRKSRKRKSVEEENSMAMVDATPQKDKTQSQAQSNSNTPTDKSTKSDKDHHHHHHHHHQNAASVRLCDIIDRAPVVREDGTTPTNDAGQPQAWRYYVHYKDFNRRMDEWIGMDRIVSPPSVGNAKARALKREEEKQKKLQKKLEEKQRAEQLRKEQQMVADLDITAPRSSRRRSTVQTTSGSAGGGGGVAGVADSSMSPMAAQKRQRRKSLNDDDAATVVTGNQDETFDEKPPAAIKEIITLPTNGSTMATTVVGGHVVATVAAQEIDEHEGLDEASLREHEEITKVKNVSFIELGRHQMETWYFSPIPKELLSARGFIEVLYICEFTFRMFARKVELQRFQQRSLKPQDRHPPGNEIYRKDNLSMFEVDGLTERIYCQNLSYIAKLFLDHKTLYFDVDPFLFYVLCEVDDRGYHPVGYYSKEKYSDVGYNLACILTFPAHQRKGYGRFLISFSYELSKKQEKVGGPERPVSDLGQKAYKPYWNATVVDFLRSCAEERDENGNIKFSALSIMDISKRTSVMAEDIVFALNQLGILKIINGVYFIAAEKQLLERLAKKWPVKEPRVDPSRLHWTPFLTDIKRDKFSIHSKKPNVDGIATAIDLDASPAVHEQSSKAH